MITIPVTYSCVLCGLQKIVVRVPARPESMAVAAWMCETVAAVSADHRLRSPSCQTKSLQNLLILMENAEWIGGPAIS